MSPTTAAAGNSLRLRAVISSTLQPSAYSPAITEPMLVPPTWSTTMPCAASALNAPMWANPRAPPPLSATPKSVPTRVRASRARSPGTAGPQMMMRVDVTQVEPFGGAARGLTAAGWTSTSSTRACGCSTSTSRSSGRNCAPAGHVGDDEHHVGLAHGGPGPRAVVVVAQIDHHLVAVFEIDEPFEQPRIEPAARFVAEQARPELVDDPGARGDGGGAAGRRERVDQFVGEAGAEAGVGQQRDGAHLARARPAAHFLRHHSRRAQPDRGRPIDDLVELAAGDPDDLAVAGGPDVRPRAARRAASATGRSCDRARAVATRCRSIRPDPRRRPACPAGRRRPRRPGRRGARAGRRR